MEKIPSGSIDDAINASEPQTTRIDGSDKGIDIYLGDIARND